MGFYTLTPLLNRVVEEVKPASFPLAKTTWKMRVRVTDESGEQTTYRCLFLEQVDRGVFRQPCFFAPPKVQYGRGGAFSFVKKIHPESLLYWACVVLDSSEK